MKRCDSIAARGREQLEEVGYSLAPYSLSEGINDLLPQDVLHVPVTQRERREEHGVQHGRAGEEAGKRAEGRVSLTGLQQQSEPNPCAQRQAVAFNFRQSTHADYRGVSVTAHLRSEINQICLNERSL